MNNLKNTVAVQTSSRVIFQSERRTLTQSVAEIAFAKEFPAERQNDRRFILWSLNFSFDVTWQRCSSESHDATGKTAKVSP